jgi:hypothetical protein
LNLQKSEHFQRKPADDLLPGTARSERIRNARSRGADFDDVLMIGPIHGGRK